MQVIKCTRASQPAKYALRESRVRERMWVIALWAQPFLMCIHLKVQKTLNEKYAINNIRATKLLSKRHTR